MSLSHNHYDSRVNGRAHFELARSLAEILVQRDTEALESAWPDTEDGRLAHPTPDHWLPLIYTHAATDDRDRVRFPMEGFDVGSISMRSVTFG